ncbi:MAG: hypothetical protein WD767_08775 [Alphaproteobacteria bacterium]
MTESPNSNPCGNIPVEKHDELSEKLRKLFASRPSISAGRMQFINLGSIKERFGDRWPAMAKRADAMATRLVNRYIGRTDMLIQVEELSWLLMFGELSEAEAQVKCGLIAGEISKLLLGDETEFANVEIRTIVVNADAPKVDSAVRLHDVMQNVMDRADAKLEETLKAPPRVAAQTGDQALKQPDDVEFIYRPLWDVKRQVISTYLCVPRFDGGPLVGIRTGYDVFSGNESPQSTALLDLRALDRAIADLAQLELRQRKLLITCTVHYQTLRSSRYRLVYLERCGRLSEWQRSLMIFEVAGLPENVPQTRLLELIGPLAPFSRSRTVRTGFTRRDLALLEEMQVHAIGIDLSSSTYPEKDLFSLMNRFVESAAKTRLRTFVHGLRSRSLAGAAVCAGFDYVDGDAITSVTRAPREIYRFQSRDLFRSLLKELPR